MDCGLFDSFGIYGSGIVVRERNNGQVLHEEPLSSWLIREEFARVWRVFIDTRARGTIHYKGSLSKAPCVLVV